MIGKLEGFVFFIFFDKQIFKGFEITSLRCHSISNCLLFSLLQEARMAAKLLEKKFGIKDVSRREEYKHILDQINQSIIYQGGTLDETYCY